MSKFIIIFCPIHIFYRVLAKKSKKFSLFWNTCIFEFINWASLMNDASKLEAFFMKNSTSHQDVNSIQ